MDLDIAGKKAFISGSTAGIGWAIAAALAGEGVEIVLNGRDDQRVRVAVARLRDTVPGAVVSGIAADFARASDVEDLVRRVDGIDILVHNVGIFDVSSFDDLSDEDWMRYLEVNLLSAVRLTRRLLPPMLDRGWGRVVFVGTESAVDVPGDMIAYGASKAAALATANGLAKLTRGTGVTVNTVLGGPTYSDGVARTVEQIAAAQGMSPDELASALIRPTSLVQRFLEPREIASLVAYLSSPLASATNGAAVRADGGVLPTLL